MTKDGFRQPSQDCHPCGARWRWRVRPPGRSLRSACSRCSPPARRRRRRRRSPNAPVQVQRVAFGAEDSAREFVGVVRARYETDLGFRVAGKIVARVVNVGDRVRVGDVVARLDPQDLQLQVESAEAEYAAAKSNRAQATADFERYVTLKARGFASDRRVRSQDGGEGRGGRTHRAGAPRARSFAQPVELCRAEGRRRGRDHRDFGRARPGRGARPAGRPARASRGEGGGDRAAGDLARRGARRRGRRCGYGPSRTAVSPRGCANSRRKPIPRRAPMPPASPFPTPTRRSPSA